MAPIVSDCLQVTIRGNQPSGEFANVFHTIGLGGAPPVGEDAALAVLDAYCVTILQMLTAQITVVDAAWVDLSSLDGPSGVVAPTEGTQSGAEGGFGAPTNTAILVTWAALGTRTQRNGRSYLPGVDEDLVDTAGLITSGYQEDLQIAVDTFLSNIDANSLALVVNSRATGGTYSPRTITGGTVSGRVATQRRRLRR